MEIVSGILKNLVLRAPKGMDVTRPTAVRARQALFDSLGPLDGYSVADLFAGSGAIGLEAASRGASFVVFADSSPGAVSAVRYNTGRAAAMGCTARFESVIGVLPGICRRLSAYPEPDYVFADPPYRESAEILSSLLKDRAFTEWSSHAVLIWECAEDSGNFQPPPPPWNLTNVRIFGSAKFLFLKQA